MKYSTLNFAVNLPDEPILFDPASLYARLQALPDQRKCRGRIYELAPILFIALLAKLMGQNQLGAIAHWAKLRATQLCAYLNLKHLRMPHKTTWGRILAQAVQVSELEKVVSEFFAQSLPDQIPARDSLVLNLDGKTLRGTIPQGRTSGVHLMAAYLPKEGLVLAQIAVEAKTNEIVAAPKLLAQLDLRAMVVTGDARQAQRGLSAQVVQQGGDYVWSVKENQPSLLTDLQILFEPEPVAADCAPHPTDFKVAQNWDKGHGRLEKRTLTVSSWLKEYTPWPHLEQAFKLERAVYTLAGQPVSQEVRYGITSLPAEVASAKWLLEIVRLGWGIENGLHHIRDVQLAEDYARLRKGQAAEVNAVLNNTVLGLLKASGRSEVAQTRREMEYKPDLALELLLTNFLALSSL
jgi:predicted transposase YbfD/YdcC